MYGDRGKAGLPAFFLFSPFLGGRGGGEMFLKQCQCFYLRIDKESPGGALH